MNLTTTVAFLVSFFLFAGAGKAASEKSNAESNAEKESLRNCLSSREFITTMEYLKERQELGLKKAQMFDTSKQVSKGCTGASSRFIKTSKLLVAVGIDSASALKTAVKFALGHDRATDAFIKVFQKSYEADFLDLDPLNAMNIGSRLSADFKGDPVQAGEDFEEMALFCKSPKNLDLPLATCAKLALEVTTLGERYDENIAEPFISLYKFLAQDKEGPKRPISDSLKIAKELIQFGPKVFENFEKAYQYAVSDKGMGFTEKEAILFAKKMASLSSLKVPSDS